MRGNRDASLELSFVARHVLSRVISAAEGSAGYIECSHYRQLRGLGIQFREK
jgi:hypothetical protein